MAVAKFATKCSCGCDAAIAVGSELVWRAYLPGHVNAPAVKPAPKPAGANVAPREMNARFDSVCPRCDAAIAKGASIFYVPGQKAWHVQCDDAAMEDEGEVFDPRDFDDQHNS